MRITLREINSSLEKYKKLISSPEEKYTFLLMEERWKRCDTLSKETIRLSSEGKTKDAIELLHGELQTRYRAFAAALLKIVELDVAIGKQASRTGDDLYDNAVMLVSLMLMAALLLSAGLGIYLVRDILCNLGKDPADLGALARKIANGDLEVQTDERAVGVYADILIMVDSIKQHAESIETITANIPGGVKTCLPDGDNTLIYVSDGLLSLSGYSREELQTQFENKFSRLFPPEEWEQVHTSILTQLLEGDTFELEFRIPHKDGHEVWILDRGRRVFDKFGQPLLYCVLIDITELKRTQKQLSFQEERCREALCATHDFVFESDRYNVFVLPKGASAWKNILGSIPANYTEAYSQGLALCHPEDQELFSQTFEPDRVLHAVTAGEHDMSLEFRLCNIENGQYWWCRTTIIPFLGMDGQLDKLFGCIVDINNRKQEERKILQVAQRDSLTGLYNKGFVEEEISRFLAGSGSNGTHALLILDIDSFKAINDNLGHLFGDAVLTDVSESIRKTFRSSDITGRIGGDEFIVLLKDMHTDPDLLNSKAGAICQALQRTFPGEHQDYPLSASVGIARYPLDGVSYRDLFRKADMALYTAKNQGKNQYCYYSETAEARGFGCGPPRTALTDIVVRSENTSFRDDVLSYIFELLYEARDINSIVTIALGIIGKHYEVSRAYVFQNSQDDQFCSNTFEWCNDGILSQKENLQNVSYSVTGNYLSSYTRDGVFYCSDITKLEETDATLYELLNQQDIKSLLHLAIFDDGKFRGYIGFDECSGKRLWTKDEIETLSILAKVLGVFLLKENISRQLVQSYNDIIAILDSLDIWAYVIDEKTYKLLYVNAKTLELSPKTRVGDPCYAAFFEGRENPCEICPKEGLTGGKARCTLEVYNEGFALWTLATASRIPWSDGKDAVLLCCVDITHYKKA